MANAMPASGNARGALQQRVTLGAIALCVVYAAVVIMWASPASFYTLDDPYIHMALAENIARGTFGVNLGEAANPSSSILWPWIMAAFEKIGLMLWAPLLVNIACFVASVRMILDFCLKRLAPDGAGTLNALIFVGLVFLSFNLFGVIFTGMEHSLHVLLSVVAVTRVIDGRYDRLTLAALVVGPLVRFEGALIVAVGVGAALVDRKWIFAIAAISGSVLLIWLYGLWLTGLGLPALPSSVLTKSAASSGLVDGSGGIVEALLGNIAENLRWPSAPMFGVFAAVLVFAAVRRRGRDRILALGMTTVVVLAMMIGKMDSYARYEAYVFCVAGLAAVHLLQAELRQILTASTRALILGGVVLVVGWQLGPYVMLTTPHAARNIDRQQHQMHRLVTECWKKPVAINDLGWVSFRNDAYVLDLYGLGSEAARKARAAGEPGWMARLAEEAAVEAAIIYPGWFPELPASWIRVGELGFTGIRVTPAYSTVPVYATRPEAVPALQACLRTIAATIPEGAIMRVAD